MLPVSGTRALLLILKTNLEKIARIAHPETNAICFLDRVLGYPYLWQNNINNGTKNFYLISFQLGEEQLFAYKVPKAKYKVEFDLYNDQLTEKMNAAISFCNQGVVVKRWSSKVMFIYRRVASIT